jgi:hypothetical protein
MKSMLGFFRNISCYALKAIMAEFWDYRSTDFDLVVPKRDCRRKNLSNLGM